MMNNKSLTEMTNEILNSRMGANKKAEALIKLGITPNEATFLARASMPAPTPRIPRSTFTYTFGVEIECYRCRYSEFFDAARRNGLSVMQNVYYNHDDIPQYKLVTDGSLSGQDTAECVTPALRSTNGFESLKNCCKSLREIGASTNRSCGLHVHIGAAGLTDQEYCNVFVNYMRLEQAIDSFMAESRRCNNSRWARSLRGCLYYILTATTREGMRQAMNCDRYFKVNACAYSRHSTIEFRQHQGTVNYTKISRWVKFLGKLVEYSKTHRLTENIDRIEDIPFLTQGEKNYFINRRADFEANGSRCAA